MRGQAVSWLPSCPPPPPPSFLAQPPRLGLETNGPDGAEDERRNPLAVIAGCVCLNNVCVSLSTPLHSQRFLISSNEMIHARGWGGFTASSHSSTLLFFFLPSNDPQTLFYFGWILICRTLHRLFRLQGSVALPLNLSMSINCWKSSRLVFWLQMLFIVLFCSDFII